MKPAKKWRKLDNAAKIFPPTSSGQDPKVFRFVCELIESVEPDTLQRAAARTLQEFPFFRYTLRHGVFWYYLEDTDIPATVAEEEEPPCQPLYTGATSPLFRILYYRSRIILEVYHVLTDGTGALQFLRTLVTHYLHIAHEDALQGADLSLGFDTSAYQRMGDSFDKYYTGKHARRQSDPPAYRLKGERLANCGMRVTIGEVPVDQLLAIAREHDTTVTMLLAACLLCAIGEEMKLRDRKKRVVATIPVNLRNYFPSDTARNFFSLVNIGISFEEMPCDLWAVTKAFSASMKARLTREYLEERLNALAALEHHPVLRLLPLALKDPIMRVAGRIADSAATVSLSNVGKVPMPEALHPYIHKFDVFITTGDMQMCSCSFGNILSLGFTSSFASSDIEQRFFRTLTAMGIPVVISSNDTDYDREEVEDA